MIRESFNKNTNIKEDTMTKHYSPVTHNIESCVGADRCKYSDNELAVHFEDHESDAANKYMEETNEKVFGLFPDDSDKKKSSYQEDLKELIENGGLGALHTEEHLRELAKYSKQYNYGSALSNAKFYEDSCREDLAMAKQYRIRDVDAFRKGKIYQRLINSYAFMMGNFYLDSTTPGYDEYHNFIRHDSISDNNIEESSNIQEMLDVQTKELREIEDDLQTLKDNRPVKPTYNPPRFFGRAKYQEHYNRQLLDYQKYSEAKEDLILKLEKTRKEHDDALSIAKSKEASKILFSKIEADLERISKEENIQERIYNNIKQETWERGFEPGKAPEIPKNWGYPDDIEYMADTIKLAKA